MCNPVRADQLEAGREEEEEEEGYHPIMTSV